MALSLPSKDQNIQTSFENYKELLASLPKEKGWIDKHMYLYQGHWYHSKVCQNVMAVQEHFKARPTDIFISSTPKSGTTWLKAILFAIMNRTKYQITNHPLLTTNPHNCVPFLEFEIFNKLLFVDVKNMPSPRLFGTHIPLCSLPESVKSSGSRMIYICRDPKDVLVSMWHFCSSFRDKDLPPLPLDEAFELFSEGKSPFGPFWEHVKEYKQASLENPDRVFFITYEEMKRDSVECTKRLAEFLGCPISTQEENDGTLVDILELCSFNNLKNLEVNKSGHLTRHDVINDVFFRKGEVGDWKNHLTPQMIESLDKNTKNKLDGTFT